MELLGSRMMRKYHVQMCIRDSSKYVGWGGIPEAFDERAGSWQTEFGMLKNILTPEEYAAARAVSYTLLDVYKRQRHDRMTATSFGATKTLMCRAVWTGTRRTMRC